MKTMSIILLLLTTSLFAQAQSPSSVTEVKCTLQGQQVQFAEVAYSYKLYSEKFTSIESKGCKKIVIGRFELYSITMIKHSQSSKGAAKELIYEIALNDKKENILKTVRFEPIDEVMEDMDLPSLDFKLSFATKWGQSKKDGFPMVSMTLTEGPDDKEPFTYVMKLNSKEDWFENLSRSTVSQEQ